MSKSVQILLGEIVAATQAVVMPKIVYNLEQTTGNEQVVSVLNYQYGHEKEIKAKISSWATDDEKRYKNFPLVWVREDLRFGTNGDFRTVTIPSIIIAWGTQPNYSSAQREVYSFNTVLRPIYQELLRQIARKREFRVFDPMDLYDATMIEHKFWGTPEDDQAKNQFTKHVDAIEILSMELTLKNDCLTTIN